MKVIKYYKKSVYGRFWNYCINPDEAKILQNLTGQKTIGADFMKGIESLSNNEVKFEEVIAPAELTNN